MARTILAYTILILALPVILAGFALNLAIGFAAMGWEVANAVMDRIFN